MENVQFHWTYFRCYVLGYTCPFRANRAFLVRLSEAQVVSVERIASFQTRALNEDVINEVLSNAVMKAQFMHSLSDTFSVRKR